MTGRSASSPRATAEQSGMEWFRALPSPYAFAPDDLDMLIRAVHEFEAAFLAHDAALRQQAAVIEAARAIERRDGTVLDWGDARNEIRALVVALYEYDAARRVPVDQPPPGELASEGYHALDAETRWIPGAAIAAEVQDGEQPDPQTVFLAGRCGGVGVHWFDVEQAFTTQAAAESFIAGRMVEEQRDRDDFCVQAVTLAGAAITAEAPPPDARPHNRWTPIVLPLADVGAIPPQNDIAWLIERGQPEGQTPTVWLDTRRTDASWYGDWTTDANEATRYATREDAEAFIAERLTHPIDGASARATEHMWGAAVAPQEEEGKNA